MADPVTAADMGDNPADREPPAHIRSMLKESGAGLPQMMAQAKASREREQDEGWVEEMARRMEADNAT